jgi:hypothetical protein
MNWKGLGRNCGCVFEVIIQDYLGETEKSQNLRSLLSMRFKPCTSRIQV